MNTKWDIRPATAGRSIIAIWLLVCISMIWLRWNNIVALDFADPDDALRLVQVRDFLAGQSWFDLVQHRIAPPSGVLMHWSRLVDLPIAAMISGLSLLMSPALAERVALVCVPLLLLLALFVALYRLRNPLGLSRFTALIGCGLLATSLSVLIQFTPLRIDHHGWQILLGTVALSGLLHPEHPAGRGGIIAGLSLAGWMQVSIEGLPYAAVFGALIAIRGILVPYRLRDLTSYLVALTGASALLLPIGHGGLAAFAPACDAMSPNYLLPLVASTVTIAIATIALPTKSVMSRLFVVGFAGAAGAATFLTLSRACLAGPFDTLAPIVYRLWYLSVLEGQPIGAQPPVMRGIILLPPVIGIVGAFMAFQKAERPARKQAWLMLIAAQIFALGMSMDIVRAMGFAHVAALPGNAWLLTRLLRIGQKVGWMPLRVIATASSVIATPLGAVSASVIAYPAVQKPEEKLKDTAGRGCASSESLMVLDEIPPSRLFVPLDIGAHILAYTHHAVIATGHHRNLAGMKATIEAFLAEPGRAEAIVRASGAHYLAFCAHQSEVERYIETAPHGLFAMLDAGQSPKWLTPVRLSRPSTVQLYRLTDPRD